MTLEQRNEYGFPVVSKLEKAKAYATAAKARNQPPCNCDTCRQIEMLPAVINITKNWSSK